MPKRASVVTPDGWLPRGEAVCQALRPPMAVWQGIPGEACRVHVYAPGRNRSLARWERAEGAPHPQRVEPACGRYSACGGCPWMHLDAAGQAAARLARVRTAWGEVGLGEHAPAELQACPDGLTGYRHGVKLAAGRSERGNVRLGAFGRGSRDVIPIPGCLAATPALRRAMNALAHHVIRLDLWPWEPETGRGILRYAVLRQSRATGQILVTLIAARKHPLLEELARALVEHADGVAGVHLHLNDAEGNAFWDPDEEGGLACVRLEGLPEIEERIADLRLMVGPGDFFQTNPSVAELILREVEAWIPEERAVLDLYCGVGGLTLAAARRGGWALGIEATATAVTRARASSSLNRLPAEFIAGRVEALLPELQQRLGGRRPVLLLNPARRGLEEGVVRGVLALEPERVIYLSCNPETQARDLRELVGHGLVPLGSQAWDMFPHTPHVEVMAVLGLPGGGSGPGRRPPRRKVVG